MTLDEASEIVSRLRVRGMSFKIREKRLYEGVAEFHQFVVIHDTIDSDTGRPVDVEHTHPMPFENMAEFDLVAWLWKVVLGVFVHEAGELFTYKDLRPFHPHRSDSLYARG